MQKPSHIILYALLACVVGSCTMQKRRYLQGYYFGHRAEVKNVTTKGQDKIISLKQEPLPPKETVSLAPETSPIVPQKEKVCDTVYLANGVRMIVKVTKIYKAKAYYLLCDSDNEAEFEIETGKLKIVKYANGKTDSLHLLPEDPFDYYRNSSSGYAQQPTPQKKYDLDRARKSANIAFGLVLAGIFFPYTLIPGFIVAAIARKRLKGQPGYEDAYRKANILTIIGAVFLGLLLFILLIAIAILAAGLI